MKTTDILYVVGNGKDGSELRWSLRALERHARNVGRVCIAGHIPDWVDGSALSLLPVKDVTRAHKHINILNCILTAIDRKLVRGDFQYSSDDHFLLKDCDLTTMPFWIKDGRLLSVMEMKSRGHQPTLYEAGLAATKSALDKLHLRTDLFCVHRNTWMSVKDAKRVREIVAAQSAYEAENYGVEPTCAFMAARLERAPNTPLTRVCDRKLYGFDEQYLETATWLSTGDGMTDKLWNFLETTFAKKSRFEK